MADRIHQIEAAAATERAKKNAEPLGVEKILAQVCSFGWNRSGSQRSNGSISVHEHARGRGLRADESELARVSTVRKEAFAPAPACPPLDLGEGDRSRIGRRQGPAGCRKTRFP